MLGAFPSAAGLVANGVGCGPVGWVPGGIGAPGALGPCGGIGPAGTAPGGKGSGNGNGAPGMGPAGGSSRFCGGSGLGGI